MNTQSATRNALSRIHKLTREIVEKSTNGNCIYRGESEHYDKVSSALYRLSPDGFDSGDLNLESLQEEILINARNHIHDYEKGDFELLTELQHYGSKTNLIDFTTDYHIALFFACNGSHEKDGRINVLQRSEDIDKKYSVKRPSKPLNRVMAQKSIFTLPKKGFIDPDDLTHPITVPANLKQWILIYLRNFQDISIQSIYNDLHGFIRDKDLRYSPEAMYPLAWAKLRLEQTVNNNPSPEQLQAAYQRVVEDFAKVLQYTPYDSERYVGQGKFYRLCNNFDCAIETFSKAIFLQPDYADAYACRGLALLHLQDWGHAKLDLKAAKDMGEDIPNLFRQDSQSIADFEQKYNVKLPADIAEMLTPSQP